MCFVMDIHLHSSYSRATSPNLTPENLHRWSALKGLTVVGTGDFTHPAWLDELKSKLEPAEEGLYRLRPASRLQVERELPPACRGEVRFLLSVEISSIYKKDNKVRKIHNLVLLPSLEAVERFNARLAEIGNLKSDGRPILGLDSRDLVEIAFDTCPEALFIPAHIWTPHFSLFGANSGFDTVEQCFGDMTPHIFALETGLSSDPPMNWRLSALDRFAIVSNSDAHSAQKLAREGTCFDTDVSFPAIRSALRDRDPTRFLGTLEFFPQEGKYHWDGHRSCGIRWRPHETRAAQGICPVCGKKVTVGVLHRVDVLADRPEGVRPDSARHYENLIPLDEIIGAAKGVGRASKNAQETYMALLRDVGPELKVLREVPVEDIARCGEPLVAEGIRRMRTGEVEILPGFDGEYGKIQVFMEAERSRLAGQGDIFGSPGPGSEGAGMGRASGKLNPITALAGHNPKPKRVARLMPPPENLGAGGSHPEPRPAAQAPPCPAPQLGTTTRSGSGFPVLTAEQAAAVEVAQGPVVVAAGPGTGKTLVLTCRAVRLILEQAVPPRRIVAVTFTNRAANEMLHRLRSMLPEHEAMELPRVGTFHRLALDLLARYRPEERRTVIDEAESVSLIQAVLRSGNYKIRARDAREAISHLKAGNAPDQGWAVDTELGSIIQAYQARLQMLRLRDYDDILLDAVSLLESDGTVLAAVRDEIDHLLVDEFQDVNRVQYRLVRVLAGGGLSLFVIGDPDQAIYGFRGADRHYFRTFFDDYPGARLFRLGTNHRSTQRIVEIAGAVIAGEPDRLDLTLRATREEGPPVRLMVLESELAEGIAVTHEIVRRVGGTDMVRAGEGGRGFGDFAVLYRTSRQSEMLETCLQKEGLPYRIIGDKGFLDSEPVQEVLTFARCAVSPEDDYRLLCALRLPLFDPGPDCRKGLETQQAKTGEPIYQILQAASRGGSRSATARKIHGFLEALRIYGDMAKADSAEHVVRCWCESSGVAEDPDVVRLLRVSSRYARVEDLLGEVLLGNDGDYERRGVKADGVGEVISLLTLHAAKGLEFPVVFIVGVEDGLIPFRDRGSDVAEERRLLYVGLTRGRDEVILTAALSRMRYGRWIRPKLSPFIRDLEGSGIEVETPGRTRRRQDAQLTLFS